MRGASPDPGYGGSHSRKQTGPVWFPFRSHITLVQGRPYLEATFSLPCCITTARRHQFWIKLSHKNQLGVFRSLSLLKLQLKNCKACNCYETVFTWKCTFCGPFKAGKLISALYETKFTLFFVSDFFFL